MTEEILEEIDKLHKKEAEHIKRADIDEKGKKSYAQLLDEQEHALDQFAFLIIIPNPVTKYVKIIVDDGFITMTMKIDRLLDIINSICGYNEMKKIKLICSEFGTPYLYDREMRRIMQINEQTIEERITAKKMKDDNEKEEKEAKNRLDEDSIFENLKKKFGNAVDKNYRHEPKKKKSFINYNKKESVRYY